MAPRDDVEMARGVAASSLALCAPNHLACSAHAALSGPGSAGQLCPAYMVKGHGIGDFGGG